MKEHERRTFFWAASQYECFTLARWDAQLLMTSRPAREHRPVSIMNEHSTRVSPEHFCQGISFDQLRRRAMF
jgi:hypothetical protein